MKYMSALILILHFSSSCYSQVLINQYSREDNAVIRKNSKRLRLKVGDLKAVDRNGKTSWAVRSTLINNSRDTLFYFTSLNCEAANFMAMARTETISLFADFEPCGIENQTVIALPPKGERTIDVMFSASQPVTSSFEFIVFLDLHNANDQDERIPVDQLVRRKEREIFLRSNKIKVEIPGDKGK